MVWAYCLWVMFVLLLVGCCAVVLIAGMYKFCLVVWIGLLGCFFCWLLALGLLFT